MGTFLVNQEMDAPPYGFSPVALKESDLGHLSNLFYILCGHFDEKCWWVPPYPGVG